MNFTFMAPDIGLCLVTLWSTGRYGFSLPKKVEISTPAGATRTFLYCNRTLRQDSELGNRAIVNLAIAHFLDAAAGPGAVEMDPGRPPYDGELNQVRSQSTRAPMRVRPGKSHGRGGGI